MDEQRATVQRLIDGEGSITFDRRHWPVVIATWVGSPTVAMVAQAQTWIDDAYADARAIGTPGLVIISDASLAAPPAVNVRRRILELRHNPELLVKVIAVAPARNVMVRAVMNALTWVISDGRFVIATSLEHAVEITRRAFEQRGLAVPDDLERVHGG